MKAEYIQHVGSDLTVVNAARCSFDKESRLEHHSFETEEDAEAFVETGGGAIDWDFVTSDRWFGGYPVKRMADKDAKLINYLAKHGHWTPFSHCFVTLRETVPIFVARQRFKHMVGFSYNEVSRRYVDSEPEFFMPDAWRKRAPNAKQGSLDETFDEAAYTSGVSLPTKMVRQSNELALACYRGLLEIGVCPEQARMVLPQSMYTSYYVSGSLAAWARLYKQRSDSHSQKEIQDLAAMIGEHIAPLFPVSWKALTA